MNAHPDEHGDEDRADFEQRENDETIGVRLRVHDPVVPTDACFFSALDRMHAAFACGQRLENETAQDRQHPRGGGAAALGLDHIVRTR